MQHRWAARGGCSGRVLACWLGRHGTAVAGPAGAACLPVCPPPTRRLPLPSSCFPFLPLQPELSRVLFPAFAHTYLNLINIGAMPEAQQLMGAHRQRFLDAAVGGSNLRMQVRLGTWGRLLPQPLAAGTPHATCPPWSDALPAPVRCSQLLACPPAPLSPPQPHTTSPNHTCSPRVHIPLPTLPSPAPPPLPSRSSKTWPASRRPRRPPRAAPPARCAPAASPSASAAPPTTCSRSSCRWSPPLCALFAPRPWPCPCPSPATALPCHAPCPRLAPAAAPLAARRQPLAALRSRRACSHAPHALPSPSTAPAGSQAARHAGHRE